MKNEVKKAMTFLDRKLVALSQYRPSRQYGGPVFIIGPPRSGTTLAYQLVTSCFDVGYITNLEARRPYIPAMAALMAGLLVKAREGVAQYSSEYGRTSGRFGPHEAGQFWYRWFPAGKEVYVREGELHTRFIKEMRQFLLFLESVKRKTLVFKNVYHCARIGALKEAFPEAVFIVVRRDPLEVAQSILRAREKVGNGREQWWSLPLPYGTPDHLPWAEQIVQQVEDVYREVDERSRNMGKDCFFDIDYASMCQDPRAVLCNLEIFLERRGVHLEWLKIPPSSFEPGPSRSVPDTDFMALKEALEAYSCKREKIQ